MVFLELLPFFPAASKILPDTICVPAAENKLYLFLNCTLNMHNLHKDNGYKNEVIILLLALFNIFFIDRV